MLVIEAVLRSILQEAVENTLAASRKMGKIQYSMCTEIYRQEVPYKNRHCL